MIVPCEYYSTFIYFLATFYIIFGTNILIQCPVSVPVCCMFLVSQNIHIKQSPNGIKTDGAYFWKIWKIRKENQREPVHEVVTRQGAPPYPREPTLRRLTLFFCHNKANIRRKSRRRFQANRCYGSPYIYEMVKQSQRRTQNQRETER